MKKILLVIDGVTPDKRTFRYAVQLCKEINAELNVLQIIRQKKPVSCRLCVCQKTGPADVQAGNGGYETSGIESSSASERIRRFLPESEYEGVRCRVIVKSGNPDQEIVNYIDTHWDVVIAVYDSPTEVFGKAGLKFKKTAIRGWAKNLTVPMVTVREKRLFLTTKYFLKEVLFMGKLFSSIKNKIARPGKKKNKSAALLHGAGAEASPPAIATEEQPSYLVVMGKESTFSNEIVAYALEMAQRMNYEIIALNTAPLSCETFKMFSSSQNNLCLQFQELSIRNAAPFQAEAEKRGIPFIHRVKFVGKDEALEEIHNEFGMIGFIVSESEPDQATAGRPANEKRPESRIQVYSMA